LRKRLVKQTAITLCIAGVLCLGTDSDNSNVRAASQEVLSLMEQEVDKDIIVNVSGRAYEAVSNFTGGAVGEPIDEDFQGDETSVFSVMGGQVVAAGENEEIGKYVRIAHDGGESLYGNLSKRLVEVPDKVKKGEIIGIYTRDENKEFYYSYTEN
jgi:murein DD-endopeptidase MepM/ murein hydrolase activator NlpD